MDNFLDVFVKTRATSLSVAVMFFRHQNHFAVVPILHITWQQDSSYKGFGFIVKKIKK
jgi:hypothetical protein